MYIYTHTCIYIHTNTYIYIHIHTYIQTVCIHQDPNMVRTETAHNSAAVRVWQGEHAAGESELVGHLQHAIAVLTHADDDVHQVLVRLDRFKLS